MTNKPDWKDAPDWANSLGIADFDCDYKGEWCWCGGTSPTGFIDVELRPEPLTYNETLIRIIK
jgi:hypothetical protein